jgi:tellurite resistance protein
MVHRATRPRGLAAQDWMDVKVSSCASVAIAYDDETSSREIRQVETFRFSRNLYDSLKQIFNYDAGRNPG